jgi:hypothetical protein
MPDRVLRFSGAGRLASAVQVVIVLVRDGIRVRPRPLHHPVRQPVMRLVVCLGDVEVQQSGDVPVDLLDDRRREEAGGDQGVPQKRARIS